MPAIRIKRGTRAQLEAAKAAGTLAAGEPYLITDEGALAVGTAANAYAVAAAGAHDHASNKLSQANTHESADTDSATTALHHTLGTGANQAAAGNHTHSYPVASVSGQTGAALTSVALVSALGDVASGTIAMDLSAAVDLWTARLTGASVTVAITRPSTGTRIGVLHLTRDGTARTAALSTESGVTARWLGGSAVTLAPGATETLVLVVTATAGSSTILLHTARYA